MFETFARRRVAVNGVTLNVVVSGGVAGDDVTGSKPPLLLLHGYPQSHAMWHELGPRLAEAFTVVAPDLRGYGDSDQPPGDAGHTTYSKRELARDVLELMTSLGFETFAVVGHDRGARVAHRLALDAPEAVTRLAVLDIVPTYHVFETVDAFMARAYYHWFFLSQSFPLPEKLIGADPLFYLHRKLGGWGGKGLGVFSKEVLAEYERCFLRPETVHATCEDYRAAATVDLEHDRADRHRKLTCPVLALWGEKGIVEQGYDVLSVWRDYAEDLRGGAVPDAGHFLVEEQPGRTLAELLEFLT